MYDYVALETAGKRHLKALGWTFPFIYFHWEEISNFIFTTTTTTTKMSRGTHLKGQFIPGRQ